MQYLCFFIVFLQLDFDSAIPPEQAWRRKLDSNASILKEFSITFMEAIKMVTIFIPSWRNLVIYSKVFLFVDLDWLFQKFTAA